ncbi:M28 family metallopeptidase [Sporosarcina limicola]|uniref:Aminopeptidase YwaD n=1 Tax=Sporosarcina limicola TaxID=34101 RepID=A0A927RFC9_9BACL|nr:M28 family metallopeptidase [Sporosarcina limicola]MBE1555392.1 aminopeptidase YwaD [Sporosarcina limicola]
MVHKKLLCSFIVLLTIIMTACSSTTSIIKSSEFDQVKSDLIEGLNVDTIYGTIEELTKEPRVAGTESEQQAAKFLSGKLESYGYKVETQPFDFERYVMPESFSLSVDGFGGPLSPKPFQYSVSGAVTGDLIDAGKGLKSDYDDIDVEGKIVLARVSDIYFSEMVLNAAKAGASAILILFPESEPIGSWSLGEHDKDFIPAFALSFDEGEGLTDFMESKGTVNATFAIEGAGVEKAKSQNLIITKQPVAKTEATKDIVLVGAHYDSVDQAPGASDNASGTAVVLELARMFKDVTTEKELRFLFFGAEEEGLYGSEHYVSEMTKNEIKRTAAMFNLDMVGSADAGELAIQTIDGMDNTVTKAASQANIELSDESIETEFGDRSDHVPFHEAGIDAALFIYNPVEEWYHSPDDTIDKLSKDRLRDVAKIVGSSVLTLTFNK